MWGICGDYVPPALQKVRQDVTSGVKPGGRYIPTYIHTSAVSSASYATMFRTSILQRWETTMAGYNNSALRCLYLNSCTCIHRVPTETDMNFLTPGFFNAKDISGRICSTAAQPPIGGNYVTKNSTAVALRPNTHSRDKPESVARLTRRI